MSWSGLPWISLTIASYSIGSIPTAYLAARLLTGQDIRQLGDHNSGAANVYRTIGAKAGLTVGVIDIAKGAVAILLVRGLVDSTQLAMLAGAAVVIGHNWPVFLGLKGGRGAATAVGVLLAMLPIVAIPLCAPALAVLWLSRKTIPAVAIFFIALPALAWPAGYSYDVIMYSAGMPVLVGLTHYFTTRADPATGSTEPTQSNQGALGRG